ncbi:MAG: nitroreductase family protein [Candidatus Nanoarchaeia archaeon]|nr:nitroreductase family protein [Candidatus Nanoarchaeia archaeon]
MELDECIRKRISVKNYLNKEVPNDIIGLVLEAASLAPSAGNLQNWKFILVKDENKKADIAEACKNQNWMNQAPAFIIVCNDEKIITSMYGDRGKLYSTQDCAIAAQNIMLKAADLGLATCWVGSFDTERIKKILEIPEDVTPEMVLTLGYSEEKPEYHDREPVTRVTFFDKWGKKTDEKSLFPLGQTAEKYFKTISKQVKKQNIWEKIKSKFKK